MFNKSFFHFCVILMVNNVVPAHVLFLFGNPMQRYCYFLCYANYFTQKWNTNSLKNLLIDSVL